MPTIRIVCPACKGKKYRLYDTFVIGTNDPARVAGTCDRCGFKGWIEGDENDGPEFCVKVQKSLFAEQSTG